MGMPAARLSDNQVCPMTTGPVPHVGGPISLGVPTILIGGMPAADVGAPTVCVGPPGTLAMGAPTVLVQNKPAAQATSTTAHGGTVAMGCPTVLVG